MQFASQTVARGFPSLLLQVLQLQSELGTAQAALLPTQPHLPMGLQKCPKIPFMASNHKHS